MRTVSRSMQFVFFYKLYNCNIFLDDLTLETTNQNESNESTQHFIELVPMEITDSSGKYLIVLS